MSIKNISVTLIFYELLVMPISVAPVILKQFFPPLNKCAKTKLGLFWSFQRETTRLVYFKLFFFYVFSRGTV